MAVPIAGYLIYTAITVALAVGQEIWQKYKNDQAQAAAGNEKGRAREAYLGYINSNFTDPYPTPTGYTDEYKAAIYGKIAPQLKKTFEDESKKVLRTYGQRMLLDSGMTINDLEMLGEEEATKLGQAQIDIELASELQKQKQVDANIAAKNAKNNAVALVLAGDYQGAVTALNQANAAKTTALEAGSDDIGKLWATYLGKLPDKLEKIDTSAAAETPAQEAAIPAGPWSSGGILETIEKRKQAYSGATGLTGGGI